MKKQILLALLLIVVKMAYCKSYLIRNEKEFESIVQKIKPGDNIIIANGTYALWSLEVSTNGTATKPITIRAETTGKVIFSGDTEQPVFKLTGSYTILRGIHFTACNLLKVDKRELVMRGGHDCIIDSNVIKGGNSGIRVNGTGHVITHNDISNVKTGIRLMYGMAGGKIDIGFYVAASDCVVKYNRIENAATGIFIGDSKNVDWTVKFDTIRYPSRVIQDVAPSNNTLADNIFINIQTNLVKQ